MTAGRDKTSESSAVSEKGNHSLNGEERGEFQLGRNGNAVPVVLQGKAGALWDSVSCVDGTTYIIDEHLCRSDLRKCFFIETYR